MCFYVYHLLLVNSVKILYSRHGGAEGKGAEGRKGKGMGGERERGWAGGQYRDGDRRGGKGDRAGERKWGEERK